MKEIFKKIFAPFQIVKIKWFSMVIYMSSHILGYSVGLTFTYFISQIVKNAVEMNQGTTYLFIFLLTIAYLLWDFLWYCNYRAYSYTQTYFCEDIYQKYFEKMTSVSQTFQKKFSNSRILHLVKKDTPNISILIDHIFNFFCSIGSMILTFLILGNVDLISMVIILFCMLLYVIVVSKASDQEAVLLRKQYRENDRVNEIFLEEISGLKEVKTLPIKRYLNQKLDRRIARYTKTYYQRKKYVIRMDSTSFLIPSLTKAFLYFLLVFFILYRNFNIDAIILIIGYFDQLLEDVDQFLESYRSVNKLSVSTKRVQEVLNYKEKNISEEGKYDSDEVFGAIDFQDVSMVRENQVILKNVSFSIKPNTITSIVGKSGGGKTLLFHLLLRAPKITSGEIYLDGKSIYEYTNRIYASNITLVKQNPFFFHMSIQNNLRLVNSNKKKQIESCKKVGIDEFIMSLEKDYHTVLKENASNLSGGQKQLLSLARALLTDAEVLLLDEVTSSLDPDTEKKIITLLRELKEDHTLLLITNRENVMKASDQILYVDNYTVKSYPSYQEFIKNHGDEWR